ncbi:hypothetical protein TWF281_003773 [Arthrobotrys megalospora]
MHTTTQTKDGTIPDGPNVAKRKTLEYCFDVARERLRDGVSGKKEKKALGLEEFLKSAMKIADLQKTCQNAAEQEGRFEKFDQLMTTLSRVQSAVDSLISAAPESVSMVWFGISTLLSMGTMTVAVRQRIYSTCNSIATMVELCLRLEQRSPIYESSSKAFDGVTDPNIWDFDIPELVFLMLDFLWHVKPHDASRSLKIYGRAIKETFTGTLEQKGNALLGHYQTVVEKAQIIYEGFLVRENIMTRLKSKDIQNDLKGISSIAKDLVDIAYCESLKAELDRQKNRIEPSKPQENHFKALESRLDDITSRREIIKWLLDHNTYLGWKTGSSGVNLLCLEAPRGHGKSIAMTRLYRDLRSTSNGILLRFFFKKGDNDIQRTQTALESLLFQLLDHDSIRKSWETLESIVEVLNPGFGSEKEVENARFLETPDMICKTIQRIASAVPNNVFLMIDALDECQDRREKAILSCLKSMVAENLRVIISARDTIKISSELQYSGFTIQDALGDPKNTRPPIASLITIGKENNAHDVREYLQYEVYQVLSRLIDPSKSYFTSKVAKSVSNIYNKANGDFTRARLIIAHLQQPSKLPLEKKIDQLPDSIGDIYMSSLEALTPSQQELVVTALKWIVWGVSGIHVTEISDHYRELYRVGQSIEALEVGENVAVLGADNSEVESTVTPEDVSDLLPFNEGNLGPEVKEVIYHLGDAGRDFFRYDSVTGLVTVDISIREWITRDTGGRGSIKMSSATHGFNRYRDNDGHTVFKFTLTPSFVKYGDILSPLFSERDAQVSLAVDILRTLNNKDFQERYMPWTPHWMSETMKSPGPKYRSRYEIKHWHDHLATVQKWWTEDSVEDPRWSELLKELDCFMEPENWFRWNIQRRPENDLRWPNFINATSNAACWYNFSNPGRYRSSTRAKAVELFLRYFQRPVHFASEHGLHLMLEYLLTSKANKSRLGTEQPNPSQNYSQYLESKFNSIRQLYSSGWDFTRWRQEGFLVLPTMELDEGYQLLNSIFERKYHNGKKLKYLMEDIVWGWESEIRVTWFASQTAVSQDEIQSALKEGDRERVKEFSKAYGNDPQRTAAAWDEILAMKRERLSNSSVIANAPDGLNRVPLYIGALDTRVRKCLMKHGANINATIYKGNSVPVLIHLFQAMDPANSVGETERPLLLQAIRDLLAEGANVDGKYYDSASAIHYAARIQDIGLFRQVCQLKAWDILAAAQDGRTPMHYFFSRRPQKSKMDEVFDMFMMLIRMSPNSSQVVNAQDRNSESPLAQAVRQGFVEGIQWLADQKVNIHDESGRGKNCFHHLVYYQRSDEIVKAMASSLLALGIDWKKREKKGRTAFYLALERGNVPLANFLLDLYNMEGPTTQNQDQLKSHNSQGENILHLLAYLPYSQNLFESVLRMAGGTIDKYHRADRPPCRRPLDTAIDTVNVEVARYLVSSGPYTCDAGKSGYNEVDRCCQALMAFDGKNPEATKKMKTILGLLFQYCPTDAISALRYYIFEPGNPFLSESEQLDMLSIMDFSASDAHGWGPVDIMHAVSDDRKYLLSLRPDGYKASVGEQKAPSRFVLRASAEEEQIQISEDGLVFTLGQRKAGESSGSPLIYFADNPIQLTKKTTYFEVTFEFAESESTTKRRAKKERYISAGFRSKLHAPIHGQGKHLGVEYNCQGMVRTLFEQRGNITATDSGWKEKGYASFEKRYAFETPPESGRCHVIGCGINPLDGRIFFTMNGHMLPHHFPTLPAQQFPVICLQNCHGWLENFKINFGGTQFAFEDANTSTWEWNGSVPEGDKLEFTRSESHRGYTVWEAFHQSG